VVRETEFRKPVRYQTEFGNEVFQIDYRAAQKAWPQISMRNLKSPI
jgi:hypothetical protein